MMIDNKYIKIECKENLQKRHDPPDHPDMLMALMDVHLKGASRKIKHCTWKYDEEHGYYDTNCGHAFTVIEGTLSDNDMRYCTYCGKVIREA